MSVRLFALLATFVALAAGGPLRAANLLINGDFETISVDRSSVFGTDTNPFGSNAPVDGIQQTVLGWQTAGYNFVMKPGDADTVGAVQPFAGNLKLWGPGTGSNNGLTATSPTGGNFVVADGAYRNAPVYQTVTGLTVGQTYRLNFWWAAGQQHTFDGATTEGWNVCFGTCDYVFPAGEDGVGTFSGGEVYVTSAASNANHGFVDWKYESVTFTATATTQKLSLLAFGTPLGQPPFSMIDGLNLDVVPEPSTWAMMLIGFGIIGATMRRRREPTVGQARVQIV